MEGTTIFQPAELARKRAIRPASFPAGRETILVLDDDPLVGELTQRSLEHFGYRVFSALNGPDGILLFQSLLEDRNGGEISLVISDMNMPLMRGMDIVRAFRRMERPPRILAVSGLFEAQVRRELEALPSVTCLQKPYSPAELVRHVRASLENPA